MPTIFFSYSHKDEALRDQLEKHLALLKRQGQIESWHDRRILAGDPIDDAISERLEAADIILLLISSDFISSDYCYSREMTRAMERHKAGSARVIPVLLRHCDWHTAPFGKLLAIPKDSKPVTSWADQDEAFTDIAKQLRLAVEALSAKVTMGAKAKIRQEQVPSVAKTTVQSVPEPRSSNLRLRKEFTEKDRDDFLRATFEYVCRYFDGSINAIEQRNPGVTGTFERIDSRRMSALIYRSGRKIAECSIRLDGLSGRNDGIAFSHDAAVRGNSYNEMLSVEVSDQTIHMKALGMAWGGNGRERQLSQEGAAEFFWELFIRDAQ